MTTKHSKFTNIKKYKTKKEMNIGILIFSIIFIYLIVTVFMYATSKQISVYEVRKGSIVKDNTYTGVILRDETVVSAQEDGYVSYFQNESTKIKAGSNIYAVSSEKLETENEPEDTTTQTLNDELQDTLLTRTQSFNENFTANKFTTAYSFKNEISTVLQSASNQSRHSRLDAVIVQSGENVSVYPSTQDGIMMLTIDGYETMTEKDIKPEWFERVGYEPLSMDDRMKVEEGDAVYKLINSDEWKVYVRLDEESVKRLEDTTAVKTKINKETETIWADFSIFEKDGEFYGRLTYENSMIRYAKERFVTVELILEDQTGLKIPKSSVIEKPFYVVPQEYLDTIGSYNQGVMVKDGEDAVFQSVDIYYTTEDNQVYLNPSAFQKDTVLILPGGMETLSLKKTAPLQGVYCINKGYAVFKQVTILCENDDYYIVEEGTDYGLTNYDHIVQDAGTVQEGEVVFQ